MAKEVPWISSADALWDGDLPETFKATAETIVATSLSDDAWTELRRIVESYSLLLSFEHGAAPISEQVKAVRAAVKQCASFIEALDVIQQPKMGTLLTTLVDDKWEEQRGRRAEADRNERAVVADLAASFVAGGLDDEEAEAAAWDMTSRWRTGSLQRPSPGADLRVQLWELQGALRAALDEISGTTLHRVTVGTYGQAFVSLVGNLDRWGDTHTIKLGASKMGDFGNHGALVYLVKAILEQVPTRYDDTGELAEVQLRRPAVADATLADQVVTARRIYNDGLGAKKAGG